MRIEAATWPTDTKWLARRKKEWKLVRTNLAAVSDTTPADIKLLEGYFLRGSAALAPLLRSGEGVCLRKVELPTFPLVFRLWFAPTVEALQVGVELEATTAKDLRYSAGVVCRLGSVGLQTDRAYGAFGGAEAAIYGAILGKRGEHRKVWKDEGFWRVQMELRDEPALEYLEVPLDELRPRRSAIVRSLSDWLLTDWAQPRPWAWFLAQEILDAETDGTVLGALAEPEDLTVAVLPKALRTVVARGGSTPERTETAQCLAQALECGQGSPLLQEMWQRSKGQEDESKWWREMRHAHGFRA